MPIYEYECEVCKSIWEAIRPLSHKEDPLDCPCGGACKPIISTPAPAQFKGEGWTPIHHPGPQD